MRTAVEPIAPRNRNGNPRRSQRIHERDERRREELVRLEREREELERDRCFMRAPRRRLARQRTSVRAPKRRILRHFDGTMDESQSQMLRLPVDVLLYLLEFLDGPSLAKMERVSRYLCGLIRGPHSPYRVLYYRVIDMCSQTAPFDEDEDPIEFCNHAPLLPSSSRRKQDISQDSLRCKVSDWKVQFVETYKYYVKQVCTVCREPGDPIPAWEVRLCRFCVVRQLVNKSAMYAFQLSRREIEVLKPWRTYVDDLGLTCTFYLRRHIDHLRKQKYSDSVQMLDEVVAQRQTARFSTENFKRKRKQREQEEAFTDRTNAILQCLKGLNLKADKSIMEEWWFPKELKQEIHEFISDKTNSSLARKRPRLDNDDEDDGDDMMSVDDNGTTAAPPASSRTKRRAHRKTIQDIMHDLETIVVPRVERLTSINKRLYGDGIAVEKLRSELDVRTKRLYEDFVLGNQPGNPEMAIYVRNEILVFFAREKTFENSVTHAWYNSIDPEDYFICDLDTKKFVRDAREWWGRRGKKPPPDRCGDMYLAHVRKRQACLRKELDTIESHELWRRKLLERRLSSTIDWYYTDLKQHIGEIRNLYEINLKKRFKMRELVETKGVPCGLDLTEMDGYLRSMYNDYEEFIKNCNGVVCQSMEVSCGCLELATNDILRSNMVLRRRRWLDRAYLGETYRAGHWGLENVLQCPEAKEMYAAASSDDAIPRWFALRFIERAERFMRRLIEEVPTFSPEYITESAKNHYRTCLGEMPQMFESHHRRLRSDTGTWLRGLRYVNAAERVADDADIDFAISKIRECEDIRRERLEMVDKECRQARLSPSFWNKAMVKRVTDNVTFQTRVRWIADNGWFSLNQLAQSWVYDEGQATLEQLLPFIQEKVKQMERDKRKEDIMSRIRDDAMFKEIFEEIDEDSDFFLRASYEIGTIYKVSNFYKAHVEDVKPDFDPDDVVRQVVHLIRDLKTGIISKSSLFVADRERLSEEEDDDDDDLIIVPRIVRRVAPNGNAANVAVSVNPVAPSIAQNGNGNGNSSGGGNGGNSNNSSSAINGNVGGQNSQSGNSGNAVTVAPNNGSTNSTSVTAAAMMSIMASATNP